MAETKTQPTGASVTDFLNAVENEQKRADSFRLVELFSDLTGQQPYMWGPTIVGFGSYHYKYASGHEGDAPLLGFSPRKAEISLYVYMPSDANEALLGKLGKFKMGKACIYVKKLTDIDLDVLRELAGNSMKITSELYTRTA